MKKLAFVPKYHEQIRSGENKGAWTSTVAGDTRVTSKAVLMARIREQGQIAAEGGKVLVLDVRR